MRLESVAIEGFRKYLSPFEIRLDECLTAIVGRNDAGKSTVLEALNIFFGNAKLDGGDFSVGGAGEVVITASFSDLPESLVLDADHTTDLAGEYLLDAEGRLCVRKSWTRPNVSAVVHALATHPRPTGEADFLINAKITKLQQLAKDLEVGDRRVSSELRKAILASQIEAGAELRVVAVPLTTDDGKAVAAALERYLPEFHLFRADRAGSESDGLAQDPAKAAIKTVLGQHQEQLADLSAQVTSQIKDLLDGVVDKLHDVDPALADRLSISDLTPDWSKAFSSLHFEDDHGVALAKRGNGTRRLVLLSFFRATVESGDERDAGRAVITAIEEPETALHPDLQRDLMRSIQDLAGIPGNQVLITTHSSNLVRDLPAAALRYISQSPEGRSVCISTSADGDASALLRELNGSLGILTDHSVRCFVMVEGRHDAEGFRALSRVLSFMAGSEILDFEALEREGVLCLIPIGGCGSLSLWEDTLNPLSRPQFCVVDSDRTEAGGALKPKVAEVVARACEGRTVLALERRELENYLTREAIEAQFADLRGFADAFALMAAGQDWAYMDIPETCARVVHGLSGVGAWDQLSEETRGRKESKAKVRLVKAFDHVSVAESLIELSPDLLITLREISGVASQQPIRAKSSPSQGGASAVAEP